MTHIRSFEHQPDYFNKKEPEIIIESPGRINLIGEHTDYNNGFVLPTAIDKKIQLEFGINHTENFCRIYSKSFKKGFEFQLDRKFDEARGWQSYILGVVRQLLDHGMELQGFDCIIESDLPTGAGVSSSAALECGIAKGLNQLLDLGLKDIEIVKLCQQAENEFVGSNCGIMDQYASVMSRKDHIILLDCRSLEAEFISADFKDCKLLLLNTNVVHNLADSEYNTRREECEHAVEIMKKEKTDIQSLRDVDLDALENFREKLGEKTFRRCKYVIEENKRVLQAASALRSGELEKFGKLMYASHKGLQHEYEVSCKELDFLVEHSEEKDFIYGARMMGGGFGGCTLNLIEQDKIDRYIEEVSRVYREKFSIELDAIIVSPAAGTQITKTII